jgi:ABC-type molybdenum transport system ATPase subunit/photorepair protein PhrA
MREDSITDEDIYNACEYVNANHFIEKLDHKYEEENWILKDVSFVINPKETVAFVGATGAGKTTILSLIVRNYDIQKGQILIDDMDIKNIKLSSLRKNIGNRYSTGISEVFKGDPVKGGYFLTLANCLNAWISGNENSLYVTYPLNTPGRPEGPLDVPSTEGGYY